MRPPPHEDNKPRKYALNVPQRSERKGDGNHTLHTSSGIPPSVTTLAHVVYVRLRQSIIPLPLVTIVTFPDILHD